MSKPISKVLERLDQVSTEKRKSIRQRVEKLANIKETLKGERHKMGDTANELKQKVTEAALHAKEVTQEKALEVARKVDDNVRENPWHYIASAAVAGLLLGFVLGRKS